MTVTLIVLMTLLQQGWSVNNSSYKSLGVFFALYEAQFPTSETIKASSESINCLKWSLTILGVLLSGKFKHQVDSNIGFALKRFN